MLLFLRFWFNKINAERRGSLIPRKHYVGLVIFLINGDSERFVYQFARQRTCCDVQAHDVFGLVIIIGSPLSSLAVDDDRPLVFVGYGEQCVCTCGQELAVDEDFACDGKFGGFVGAQSPNLSEGHEVSENFPTAFVGLTINNLQVGVFVFACRYCKWTRSRLNCFLCERALSNGNEQKQEEVLSEHRGLLPDKIGVSRKARKVNASRRKCGGIAVL